MSRHLLILVVLIAGGGASAQTLEKIYYDGVDADGNLTGGYIMAERPVLTPHVQTTSGNFVSVIDNGDPANRIDLVCVGDGYLATELDLYAGHVDTAMTGMFAQEPYRTYVNLFNVHRVDVVSNDSGVDNDPVQGIYRNTAMDMAYWCNGVERLLCVNVTLANLQAAAAPDVDQVFAIANSTKYGGAGYTSSELATFSGGNFQAVDLALHEMGHSLGDLADEYDYGGYAVYSGPEPVERNVSTLDADAMSLLGAKWAPWLGDPGLGFGELVDTYEGAYYSQYGIYRPTATSKMRALGQPFNLPSLEGLILQFYSIVDPIDAHTPTGSVLAGTEVMWVDPVDPVDHPLDIQWFLDGDPIVGAVGDVLDLGVLGLTTGPHDLQVTVTDNTELVRDETARASLMTQTVAWSIEVDYLSAVTGDPTGAALTLLDNVPNPFNPSTTVRFTLPAPGRVRAAVYDTRGRLVARLADEALDAGVFSYDWHGTDTFGRALPSGTYFCRLTTPSTTLIRKMSLLR